ncbi:MAG: LPS-assembly protein LptD [Hyphomicrobiaceae bacterium]
MRRRAGGAWLTLAVIGAIYLFTGIASAQQRDPSLALPPLPGAKSKSAFGKKLDLLSSKGKIDRSQPIYIQTDKLVYDDKNNRVIAQGNVEIYYNSYILTADKVIYDQGLNKLLAEGNAQLKAPNGDITRADRFEATDDFRDAFIQSLSVVTKDDTRIAAERAVHKEGNVTEFEKAKFTPCRNDPGMPPLWCIGASRIIHDQTAATITYQDAQFQLFGVTIFYLPYFQHPDPSVKRQSGFLMPSYSVSSTLGASFEIPYYFALAPNYDFTFRPSYFSDRGVLWAGEWRHRLATGQYIVNMAAIEDPTSPTLNSDLGNWRGSIQTKGQFSLASWWKYGWDVTLESDESFRRTFKLDSILQTDRVNVAYLQGISERNYFAANFYHFGGLFLEDDVVATSYVHPVIDYNYILGTPVLGGQLSFTAHARALTRNDGTDNNHIVLAADWKRKMIDPIGQVWTPFASVRGDVASWTNLRDPDNPAVVLADDTVTRAMAVAGLTYSYPFVAHTKTATHVIEPTAQIVVRPGSVDQRKLPNEDARSLVFDDTLLFDTDRFSGYDRFETGTRLNVGVQYTLQTASGFFSRVVLGQSLHLAGENAFALDPGVDAAGVSLYDPLNGLETDRSDYIAGLYVSPFTGFNLVAQARFDENDWSLRRQDTALNMAYGPLLAQLGYAYTKFDSKLGVADDQQEVIGTLGLRLTDRWSVVGQVRYDIDDRATIQDLFQVKYQDECFVLSASYIETFVENEPLEIKPDRTLMLRFELKHLGGGGYSTNALNHIFGDTNQGGIPR